MTTGTTSLEPVKDVSGASVLEIFSFWGHIREREAWSTTLLIKIFLHWSIYWEFLDICCTLLWPVTRLYSCNRFWPYSFCDMTAVKYFLFVHGIVLAESPLLFTSLWNLFLFYFDFKYWVSPWSLLSSSFLSLLFPFSFLSSISFSWHCPMLNCSKEYTLISWRNEYRNILIFQPFPITLGYHHMTVLYDVPTPYKVQLLFIV